MRFDWWTLALQTVNFAVLVWLLHRFLYKPVLRMIDERRAEVEKQYADAAAAKAKAENERAAIETERAGIAAERAAALRAAATEAEEAAAARRAQAEREAAAFTDEARKSLAAERDEALGEVRRAALGLGTDIARRLLSEVPTELRTEAWLERIERHLAGLAPVERDGLIEGLKNGGTLRVVTAVPLTERILAEYRARLCRVLGDRTPIAFGVDSGLVAGVELHFPNAILRFSWQSALAAMRAEIEGHENAR
jgi:F-type H+-transporting ATPase subunit b